MLKLRRELRVHLHDNDMLKTETFFLLSFLLTDDAIVKTIPIHTDPRVVYTETVFKNLHFETRKVSIQSTYLSIQSTPLFCNSAIL